MRRLSFLVPVLFSLLLISTPVHAQGGLTPVKGPQTLTLGNSSNTTLNLPQGAVFIRPDDARKLLEEDGDTDTADILGLVSDQDEKLDWFGLLRYADVGYIRDDEGERLNASSLLNDIREGTAEANKERRARGIPELDVVGWFQPPSYNRQTHTLTWSIIGRERGSNEEVINYSTVVLGRRGILSCTIVGDKKDGPALQAKEQSVKRCIVFSPGSDYAAFRSGDKIAQVTMTGLVTGGAAAVAYGAAKTGFFAKIGVLLLALKKFIVVIVVGIVAVVRAVFNKLSGRGNNDTSGSA
jgi:uncharacterized membrane-anchored protein